MVRGQLRSSGMPLAMCWQSCVGIGALPCSADDGFRSSEPLTGEGEGCALPEHSVFCLTFDGSLFQRQDHDSFGGACNVIPGQWLNNHRRVCHRSTERPLSLTRRH